MLFYLTIIILVALESNGQESCVTISGTEGHCIKIDECSVLFNLLNQIFRARPLPAENINTLRRSQCGIDGSVPKVCCPLNDQPTSTVLPPTPGPENPPQFPNVTNHPNLRLIDYSVCAVYTLPRIIGGNKTELLQFPWMALISYNKTGADIVFRCAGTLISKRYVLTAAHCVTGLPRGLRLSGVRLGDYDLSTERDCIVHDGQELLCSDGNQDFSIEAVHAHADFSTQSYQNDIALIRLNKDADFRNNVRPICLPFGSLADVVLETLKRSDDPMNREKNILVAGWGMALGFSIGQKPRQIYAPIVPIDECTRAYKPRKIDIWHKQLCASNPNQETCVSDGGGSAYLALFHAGNIKYFQEGVVSFGPNPCTSRELPVVYTSVLHYMDWILDQMTD